MSAVRQFENHEDGPGKKAGVVRIALAGNPNSGKTTVFNGYTGARQHVGNYPGVTVDRKEGHITVEGTPVTVVDLPGTYSLTAYSQEELVARRELSAGHVQAVIDVVDASALERNLLLTVQMLEMGIPVVLCCNMMDEARAAGIHIDMEHLGKLLGIPVLPMVARSGEGLQAAMKTAIALAREGKREPLRFSYGSDLDPVIADMEKRIAESGLLTNRHLPSWVALKMLEGDSEIWHEARLSDAHITAELEDICKKTAAHVRDTLNANLESIITDYRYGYIRSLLRDGIVRQDAGKDRLALSDKLDKVLTNAFFGPLIMIGVLYLMFQVTFELGAYPQGWVEDGFTWLGDAITAALPEGLAQSLIVDGIIAGVGGVLSFVPLILIMFVLISFMEDSGYMARVAYMMDRIFRFFGLHGASVMPYIIAGGIAGGCAIPGVMATRTLRSPKEKLATMLTLPYMACGAKLPVYLLLVGAFFPNKAADMMFAVILASWLFAFGMAWLLRKTVLRGEATPLVMEMPPYRLPTLRGICTHCWERTWMYLKKAGTILAPIAVLIWAGMTFPALDPQHALPYENEIARLAVNLENSALDPGLRQQDAARLTKVQEDLDAARLRYSFAGRLGAGLEGITAYAGFNWRTDVALIGGIAAKEAIISTLGTAYALGEQNPEQAVSLSELLRKDPSWNQGTALALLVFVMLYAPCFVTLVVIRQESGSWKWVGFSLVVNTLLAFVMAVGVYQACQLVQP